MYSKDSEFVKSTFNVKFKLFRIRYVCIFVVFQGTSTSQVIGAHNEIVWMIMMAK